MAGKGATIRPEWYGAVVSVFVGAVTRTIVLNDKTSAADIALLVEIKHPCINDTK